MKKKIIIIFSLVILLFPISVKTNLVYQINYYWFDTSGNYLRQNTTATENLLTGYDSNTGDPKTLRELGYAPANCYPGSPPVPIDPSFPDVRFYSHP